MYIPEEHPLQTIARFLAIVRTVQQHFPESHRRGQRLFLAAAVLSAVAAGVIAQGWASIAGLGRGALAYPDFARDILEHGAMVPTENLRHLLRLHADHARRRAGRLRGARRGSLRPDLSRGRRLSQDLNRELAAKCRVCATPDLPETVPAGVDIPGFIAKIAEGDEQAAYQVLRQANPLPEICAHICPVEVQCEAGCIETDFSPVARAHSPVAKIRLAAGAQTALEHAGAAGGARESARQSSAVARRALPAPSACWSSAIMVTIFTASEQPGGTVRATIPAVAHAATTVLNEEIAAILASDPESRLSWRAGEGVDTRRSRWIMCWRRAMMPSLSVWGLPRSQQLDCPRPASGVIDALEFLRGSERRHAGGSPSRRGDRRRQFRHGCRDLRADTPAREDVYLVYRRSFAELPAWPDERNHALDAGVHFLILAQPVSYLTGAHGELTGLADTAHAARRCRRLGPPAPRGDPGLGIHPGSGAGGRSHRTIAAGGPGDAAPRRGTQCLPASSSPRPAPCAPAATRFSPGATWSPVGARRYRPWPAEFAPRRRLPGCRLGKKYIVRNYFHSAAANRPLDNREVLSQRRMICYNSNEYYRTEPELAGSSETILSLICCRQQYETNLSPAGQSILEMLTVFRGQWCNAVLPN